MSLCMSICMFDHVGMSDDLIPAGAGIDEEQVSQSAPLVRALLVQRLEMMWRAVEPHINPEDDDRRPDPRYLEAGIRVTDRLAKLYRLDHPQPGANAPELEGLAGKRQRAREFLAEIEGAMRQDG